MAYTNNRNIPLPLALWLARDTYDKDPTYISGSQLAMSDRQVVLSYRTDPDEDLANLVAARLGHAINDSIDAAWKAPMLMERIRTAGYSPLIEIEINPVVPTPGKTPVYIQERFNEHVAGKVLSGAPDLIYMGRLTDYKSTSVFIYQNKIPDDYMWQLTVYRYLARHLIVDDTATIQFILKDWSRFRAEKDKEYPQTPCPTMLVRVGTAEECLARITTRIERLKSLMSVDESELPFCTDEELWLDAPTYRYYKNPLAPATSRATRVFDSQAEANAHMAKEGGKGRIDIRKGEPKACNYCQAALICSQRASWNT